MKNKTAEKISNLPVDNLSIQKPVLPKIGSKSLVDYIARRSTTLFSILGISHKFLGDPDWRLSRVHQNRDGTKRFNADKRLL